MRVVWYKLPQGGLPEDVVVMEEPFYESEPALLMGKSEKEHPLFYVSSDMGTIEAEEGTRDLEHEPFFKMFEDGFEAVIPARNRDEAYDWARRFDERLHQFYSQLESEDG